MILDIVFVVVMIYAVWKGYQRGLIVGIFSLLAVIVGLAAAMKLSTVAAEKLSKLITIPEQWLPIIAFAVVFFVVVLAIRFVATIIEKAAEKVMMGSINKLGGVALYAATHTIIFSVLLFYAEQMKLIQPEMIKQSVVYNYVQPWGPQVIDQLGSIIPLFKDSFEKLKTFFEQLSKKA
jgi:membrane protein required for colicin V production